MTIVASSGAFNNCAVWMNNRKYKSTWLFKHSYTVGWTFIKLASTVGNVVLPGNGPTNSFDHENKTMTDRIHSTEIIILNN